MAKTTVPQFTPTKPTPKGGLSLTDKTNDYLVKMFTDLIDNGEKCNWEQPWITAPSGLAPMNIKRKGGYNLLNSLILDYACQENKWKTAFFMTMNTMREKGVRLKMKTVSTTDVETGKVTTSEVREQGNPVFQNFATRLDKDGNRISYEEYDAMTEDEQAECREFWHQTVEIVYNLDQTTFPEDYPTIYEKYVALTENAKKPTTAHTHKADVADGTLDYILETNGAWFCPISHDGLNSAHCSYYDANDIKGYSIHLPLRDHFKTATAYYGTALHEMAHSTKGLPGYHRDYGRRKWGDKGYATEELVAELSSAIVMHDLGLEKTIDKEHIAYAQSWKKGLKDKEVLSVIIDDIMRASRKILSRYNQVSNMRNSQAA